MRNVVIAGASGVVGARVLAALLERADVGRVVALGRRELAIADPKLESKVVDLQRADAIAAAMPDDVAVALCCLGTTMKQAGSKEAFRAVDHDAVLAFAAAAHRKGAQRFVGVSSLGASPRAHGFYARTKGLVEDALAQVGFPQVTLLRPALLDDEGARGERRVGERVGLAVLKPVFAVLGRTRRFAPIRVETVARAMVALAFDDTAEAVRRVESDALHTLGA